MPESKNAITNDEALKKDTGPNLKGFPLPKNGTMKHQKEINDSNVVETHKYIILQKFIIIQYKKQNNELFA